MSNLLEQRYKDLYPHLLSDRSFCIESLEREGSTVDEILSQEHEHILSFVESRLALFQQVRMMDDKAQEQRWKTDIEEIYG